MNSEPDCSPSMVLTEDERELLRAENPWCPNPGQQSLAYLSEADELYYGGAAGGGKSQLLIGLGLTAHRDTLLLRRTATETKALSKAIQSLNYGSWKWIGHGGELRTPDGRTIEIAGCHHAGDELSFQGRAHDLKAFDELPTFLEAQYTFIIGWNRPLDPRRYPNQRSRVVGAGNPPTDPEGEWVLRRWAAWMPGAEYPARPGELRWYTTIEGKEVACESAAPIIHKGTAFIPRSRTFIPARLEDNPDLLRTGYAATLEAMPEPLRSMLRYGDMLAGRVDDAWQLVPTRWVVESQRRWVERQKAGNMFPGAISAVGVDVARGGAAKTVLAVRHGATIGPLIRRAGKDTPDGQSVVALLVPYGAVPANIDATGVGASAYDVARMSGLSHVNPILAASAAHWRDPKLPELRFMNLRAAMMWRVRSLLDPEGGPADTRLALPPDAELLADLTAPRYALRAAGVQVESKDDIRERIGRSTDASDAVALACWESPRASVAWG